jgi:hypothetical protein
VTDYTDKKLVLLMMGIDDNGADEWVKFFRTVKYVGTTLFLDRGSKGQPCEIREGWLERIEPVPDALRDILGNADIWLRLTVSNLPPDANDKDYLPTGFKVPKP